MSKDNFGWLDEALIKLSSESIGQREWDIFRAGIIVRFTTQAKQHQADLLRAQLRELDLFEITEVDHNTKFHIERRKRLITAELDKLEGENE